MTQEVEELSGLVSQIYDAALDPALWTEALAGLCDQLYRHRYPDQRTISLRDSDPIRCVTRIGERRGPEPLASANKLGIV